MAAALKLLHQVAGTRRQVAILGTMRELGEYAESAHRNIGRILPKLTKVAVLIGPYRDIMKEEAIRAGLKEENIYIFEKPEQAKSAAKKLIKKGDFVLVKASRALHFEDIVKSLMKHPNRAHELLVH